MKIILFADDRVLTATSEIDLKGAIHRFYLIMNEYNLKISTQKKNIMEFHWKGPGRCKLLLDDGTVG
jgi:endonuclease I